MFAYLPYLIEFEISVSIVACLLATTLMARLLYYQLSGAAVRRLRVKHLSAAMLFYLSVHAVCCASCIP
jgi:hypothetical protein